MKGSSRSFILFLSFLCRFDDLKFTLTKRWRNAQVDPFRIISCGSISTEKKCSTAQKEKKWSVPSTKELSRVMLAAFRRPAGRLSPIRSRLSRNSRPPFFDLALLGEEREREKKN